MARHDGEKSDGQVQDFAFTGKPIALLLRREDRNPGKEMTVQWTLHLCSALIQLI